MPLSFKGDKSFAPSKPAQNFTLSIHLIFKISSLFIFVISILKMSKIWNIPPRTNFLTQNRLSKQIIVTNVIIFGYQSIFCYPLSITFQNLNFPCLNPNHQNKYEIYIFHRCHFKGAKSSIIGMTISTKLKGS